MDEYEDELATNSKLNLCDMRVEHVEDSAPNSSKLNGGIPHLRFALLFSVSACPVPSIQHCGVSFGDHIGKPRFETSFNIVMEVFVLFNNFCKPFVRPNVPSKCDTFLFWGYSIPTVMMEFSVIANFNWPTF